MKGNMNQLMQQAQRMQEAMQKAQQALAGIEVSGAAGGGLVTVTISCNHQVRRVSIDPGLLGDDRDMLEDLVAAAVNDALRKVEQATQEHMNSALGGMKLPGMNLPF
ncbi:YbaB/EbfC family nucleoid-associated protein [Immundisolibacter sp.]|jgi:DNA-binding YbaB/EbfC family protein|uniref:YbaB/EbfC family nucleoid-associated protein n=1 Tax=Immundisolibacter sp. TaxID=1934948 RepID=UPI001987DE01|nr:YbaB/EbfC family nucleoid-associated protein [Immundisolibacter sp.]MBC7161817.1 YbaB/EbfC family nucleoid-associated protein [Immundisolibacter sp.]MEA3219072.1 Nucleoid-associated protein YbaB [Immundisolibacter sp.]